MTVSTREIGRQHGAAVQRAELASYDPALFPDPDYRAGLAAGRTAEIDAELRRLDLPAAPRP
jgi:hypothetical protein